MTTEHEEKKIKVYFKGGKGIKEPVDFDGNKITEGSILTSDSWEDNNDFFTTFWPTWTVEEILKYKSRPLYIVKWNPKGFFFGEGLQQNLYLHDFRFKHTKIVQP